MPLIIKCLKCGQLGKVPDTTAGKRVRCPKRGEQIEPQSMPDMEPVQSKWVRFLMLFILATFILMALVAIIGKNKIFPS
jgi:uncharacterized paraquat-inducible protein A